MRALLADEGISELRVKVETQLSNGKFRPMKVAPYAEKEGSVTGVLPPYRPDGTPTALGPATIVDDSSPKFREDPDEVVARMVAEAESKPERKKSDELEYITTGDDGDAANDGDDSSYDEDEGSDEDEDDEEEDESDEEEEEAD